MLQTRLVVISKGTGSHDEYIIKDKDNIIVGRFDILDLDLQNRKCNISLKFYRNDDYELLKESLRLILKAIFKDGTIRKINIITVDTICLSSFLDLGFILEGVFFENIYVNGSYSNEISMGITREDYNIGQRNNIVELESKNIVIKLLTPENSNELLEYYIRNRKHLEEFEPTRDSSFFTLETQKTILNDSYRQFLNGTAIDFGIFKDREFIGKIRISNIVAGIFKSGIIGYSIDKGQQGKGYMKEAVKLAIDYAFKELQLHRLEASVLIDNERSKGVLLSCGFKELGINKKYLYINGKWRDHITYYITK